MFFTEAVAALEISDAPNPAILNALENYEVGTLFSFPTLCSVIISNFHLNKSNQRKRRVEITFVSI